MINKSRRGFLVGNELLIKFIEWLNGEILHWQREFVGNTWTSDAKGLWLQSGGGQMSIAGYGEEKKGE